MSGIAGIWNLDGRPVDPAMLARMTEVLAHRGPDGTGYWVDGPIGLAGLLFKVTSESFHETQPYVHPSGVVVVFDGRLDDREDLLRLLLRTRVRVSSSSPDPVLVAAAYETFGESFAERLNGDFALGVFDARCRKLFLARDSIGVRPLFYHSDPGRLLLFASEAKFILAHPGVAVRPNDRLLADFLLGSGGQTNVDETFFDGVWRVPPAHMVIGSAERVDVRRYWDFDPAKEIRFASPGDYAAAFRDHFDTAVRRRLRSAHPVAVSVSGGLDSSAILCMAETLRCRASDAYPPVRGITYVSRDGSPCDEESFVVEIERAYGLTVERVPIGDPGFMEGCREEAWHVEAPFLDRQWNGAEAFDARVRDVGARVLLTGHWGDQVLFERGFLVDLAWRLAWSRVWANLAGFRHWSPDVAPGTFPREFMAGLVRSFMPNQLFPWARRLRARLSGRTRSLGPYTEAFQALAFRSLDREAPSRRTGGSAYFRGLYSQVRSGYHVLCMEWSAHAGAMHGLERSFPFLDRDLVSFLMAVPGEVASHGGVPKWLLREGLYGILPHAIAGRRGKGDFTHRVREGARRERGQMLSTLRSCRAAIDLGYMNPGTVHETVLDNAERAEGGSVVARRMVDLVGLAVWSETFFGSQTTQEKGNKTCATTRWERGALVRKLPGMLCSESATGLRD